MSTLWTPEGERPIRRDPPAAPDPGPSGAEDRPRSPEDEPLDEAEQQARLAELQEQLARTPAAMIVANHAFGLFELAALHLSLQPPQLDQAVIAIDAFAALVEGLAGRLGEAEPQLKDGLAQLRLAFVQIRTAAVAGPGAGAEG